MRLLRSSLLLPLSRYADFRGRSRRREFWRWALFAWLASWALGRVDAALGLAMNGSGQVVGGGMLSALFSLATLVPTVAVAARRLHDTDRRWWWLLLPVGATAAAVALAVVYDGADDLALGLVIVLIFFGCCAALTLLLCLDGTRGSNRFGPDPKDPASTVDLAEVFR